MNRTSLCASSLLVVLVALGISSGFVQPAAAESADRELPGGVLRLRGGLVFPDRDGDPGPGWSAGGALGLALTRNVLISMNYDHMDLDVPSGKGVNPTTIQLEFGVPNRHRITPRAVVGAGLYSVRSRGFPIARIFPDFGGREEVRYSTDSAFGMNFGGGVSIPLRGRTMFDVDIRYHQTMGDNSSLVIGTASAGLSYALR